MSSELTLDQLAAEGGDDEGFELGGSFRKKLKLETTYPVKIVKQTIKTSESGYYVAQFELGVIGKDGDVGTGDTVTMCLPTFPVETVAKLDAEKLESLKQNWGKQLHSLLRAVQPQEFSIYKESVKQNGKWKFFDADGHEMTNAEKVAREKLIARGVIGAAKAMAAGKYSIEDARCYFVWAPNKKDAANPYANFWSVVPDKYPLAE